MRDPDQHDRAERLVAASIGERLGFLEVLHHRREVGELHPGRVERRELRPQRDRACARLVGQQRRRRLAAVAHQPELPERAGEGGIDRGHEVRRRRVAAQCRIDEQRRRAFDARHVGLGRAGRDVDARHHAVEARELERALPGRRIARADPHAAPAVDVAGEELCGVRIALRDRVDARGGPHGVGIERGRRARATARAGREQTDRPRRADRERGRNADHAAAPREPALERAEERVHRRPPPLRIGREPAQQDRAHRARDRVPRQLLRAGEHAGLDLVERVAAIRAAAGERLPQRDAERELVARRANARTGPLLGRHVRRRAEHRAGHRARGRARHGTGDRERIDVALGGARQAEIGDHDLARVAAQYVRRLEVAVDEARVVRGGEPAARGDERRDDVAPRRLRGPEPVLERDAVDELHGDEVGAVCGADVEHGDHVGMRQLCHRARFAEQPGACVGARCVEQLDRDASLEVRIERGVDDAHPAAAEHALEPEPAERSGPVGHRGRAGAGRRRSREIARTRTRRHRGGLGELVFRPRGHGSPYITRGQLRCVGAASRFAVTGFQGGLDEPATAADSPAHRAEISEITG